MHVYAAHELKAWLLHYLPVILKGILPNEYYQHYLLLVEGVFLLLKDSADIKVVYCYDITASCFYHCTVRYSILFCVHIG